MPTAKSLGYDHTAYLDPIVLAGSTTVGASGTSQKFAAFTAMQIRGCVIKPNIATTAAGSQPLLYTVSGTTTATQTLSALTSAAITVQTNILATAITLVQGDTIYLTHGTDATASVSFAMECYPVPGANLLVP